MKLSEIRPCDNCGGKIAPAFYIVKTSLVMFNPQETNQVLGMTQYFGGALGLAEAMAPEADVVKIAGDEQERLWDKIFICMDCFCKGFNIAQIIEKVNERKAPADSEEIKDAGVTEIAK